jgi:hypothetical protein
MAAIQEHWPTQRKATGSGKIEAADLILQKETKETKAEIYGLGSFVFSVTFC